MTSTPKTAAMRFPIPPQAPAKEGLAQLGNVKLWYSDTGGTGPAVIFLHPSTGSGLIWSYQQPVFVAAGYRVITYSRRGHAGSEAGPKDDPGTGADDLKELADALGVARFHAVGLAAGGITGMDFALACPQRLISLVEACTIVGIEDESYLAISNGLRPEGFNEMPPDFRELGPSYRAVEPEGVRRWLELEHKAVPQRVLQRKTSKITWAAMKTMTVPTLLVTGDADLYTPPSVLRMFAQALPNSEAIIVAESGHSVYWEQPDEFNRIVLGFLKKHR